MTNMKYQFYPLHRGEEIESVGELFDSKAEIRDILISYHESDWTGGREIQTLSIDEILEHGQWGLREILFEHCPLCEESAVEFKQWQGTDIYVCIECPFIGFKYFTKENLDALNDYLNFN